MTGERVVKDQPLAITAHGLSRTGRRPSNEDSIVFETFGPRSPIAAFGLVCDGMGGHLAGEVASTLAVEMVSERLRAFAKKSGKPEELAAAIGQWVQESNDEIFARSQANPSMRGMGTTLALGVVLPGGRLFVANLGDSRIFLVRGGTVSQLSVDHTALAEHREALGLTEGALEEFAMSPLAHALTRSLGHEKKAQPALRSDLVLEEGDGVLLMSDGVTDVLRPEHLAEALAVSPNPAAAIEEIYSRAFEGGSKDNISVIFLSAGRPYLVGSRLPRKAVDSAVVTQPNMRPEGGLAAAAPYRPQPAPRRRGAAFTLAALVLAAAWVSAFFLLRELPAPREADGAPHTETALAPRPLPTLAGAPPEEEVPLEPASPLETGRHEDASPRIVPALVPASAPSGVASRPAASAASASAPVATVAPPLRSVLPGSTGAPIAAEIIKDAIVVQKDGLYVFTIKFDREIATHEPITLVSMRFVPSGLTLRQPGAGFPTPSCSISATAITCTTPVEPDDRRPKGDGSDLLELSLQVGGRPFVANARYR